MSKTKTEEKTAPAPVNEAPKSNLATQASGGEVAAYDYGQYAGAGMEGTSQADFLIPFLRILQSNSPQVDPASATKVDGAAAGMILNNVTGAMYDGKEGVPFIPVARDHNFVKYIPRARGGGMQGIFSPTDPLILKLRQEHGQFGRLPYGQVDSEGNPEFEFVETFYIFGMPVLDGIPTRAVLGFSSTQIKKYKAWMTTMDEIVIRAGAGFQKPPMFAHRWRLKTQPEKNKKGSFFGWRIVPDGVDIVGARLKVSDPLFMAGVQMSELIKSGAAKVAHDDANNEDVDGGKKDDDIPF